MILADEPSRSAEAPGLRSDLQAELPGQATGIRCLHDIIREHAARDPAAPAILTPGRSTLSYRRLWEQVLATVEALNSMGIGRNDRVAVVLPNGPEAAVALLGVASGATCAPLNPDYKASEFDSCFSGLKAKALMVQAGQGGAAREAARNLGLQIIDLSPDLQSEAGDFALTSSQQQAAIPAQPGGVADPDDQALVLHTSGTTGQPKFFVFRHTKLVQRCVSLVNSLSLTTTDRYLGVMPLFHATGVNCCFSSLVSGGSVICTPGFEASEFCSWTRQFRPTWYSASPAIHQAVLEKSLIESERKERWPFRLIRSGTGPLPSHVEAGLEVSFGVRVINGYGTTEKGFAAVTPLAPLEHKAGSVGRVLDEDVAIMDDEGTILPSGKAGEIVLRNLDATPEPGSESADSTFVNGWYRTGDSGYLDSEGFLFLTGRLKEIINRGGEKISPREVDEVLLSHPAVAEAATFPVTDPRLGEDVAAAVVLRPGASVTAGELRRHAAAQLAPFKVPRQILISYEIPKSPIGKIQRFELAEKLGLTGGGAQGPAARPEYVPPRTPVEEMVADIWASVIGIERVGVSDNFFELGGHSLLAARVLAEIEQRLGQHLAISIFLEEPTIAHLARAIEAAQSRGEKTLLPGGRPILFTPALEVQTARKLATLLGPEIGVTALLKPFLNPKLSRYSTIEDMASGFLREMRTLQPQGPYLLAGHSFGGVMAYEMAQQLHSQGETVTFLAMLDSGCPQFSRKPLATKLGYHWSSISGVGMTRAAWYLSQLLRGVIRILRAHAWSRFQGAYTALHGPLPETLWDSNAAYYQAKRIYTPKPYPGKVTLFWGIDQSYPTSDRDPRSGWQALATGGVEVRTVPGDHATLVQEPYLQDLARQIGECIKSVAS